MMCSTEWIHMNASLNMEEIYVFKNHMFLKNKCSFKKDLLLNLINFHMQDLFFLKKNPIYPIPTRKERKKGKVCSV